MDLREFNTPVVASGDKDKREKVPLANNVIIFSFAADRIRPKDDKRLDTATGDNWE